jgi:hypothetical protein
VEDEQAAFRAWASVCGVSVSSTATVAIAKINARMVVRLRLGRLPIKEISGRLSGGRFVASSESSESVNVVAVFGRRTAGKQFHPRGSLCCSVHLEPRS